MLKHVEALYDKTLGGAKVVDQVEVIECYYVIDVSTRLFTPCTNLRHSSPSSVALRHGELFVN